MTVQKQQFLILEAVIISKNLTQISQYRNDEQLNIAVLLKVCKHMHFNVFYVSLWFKWKL